jgi:hypothetical protein
MRDWKDQLVEHYPWLFKAPHWRDTSENPERVPVPLAVGDGWAKLISDLASELDPIWRELPSEVQKGIFLMQCKEKFGGLRFYLSQGTDRMFDAIQKAETASFRICEECGCTGRIRKGGWIRTLCDKCVEKTGYKERDHDDSYRA